MPDWEPEILRRLAPLKLAPTREAEIAEELAQHLEDRYQELLASGRSEDAAFRTTLDELKGEELLARSLKPIEKSFYREPIAQGKDYAKFLSGILQDVRYALRMLRKSPGFTAVAVLTLALGIGANTAIFSLVNAVMLKLLPVRNPEQLVVLNRTGNASVLDSDNGSPNAAPFSYPTFQEIRDRNDVFSSVFGFVPLDVFGYGKANVNLGGQAGLAEGELVTGDYFSALGVVPILGRAIAEGDEQASAPRVAVISYDYWFRRFGRSPKVVGKGVTINGVPFTIVGVAPPKFFGVQPGRAVDLWIPLTDNPKLLPYGMSSTPGGRPLFTSRDWWWLMIMARLKQGVTTQQAAAQTEVLFQQSIRNSLKTRTKTPLHIQLEPADRGLAILQQQFSEPLWILTAVVGIVLLIACGNVAGLLVARSQARRKEIAVRLSLGAARPRVVRQLVTEGVLLASISGAVGLLLAHWASRALLLLMSSGGQRLNLTVRLDAKVLGFTAGVSLLTVILFGLAPALHATRMDLAPALKEASGQASSQGRRTGLRLGNFVVVSQVALSLLLLVGAGLFVRTLENLESQNLGFSQDHILLFSVNAAQAGYRGQSLINIYGRLLRRFQALPGVISATTSENALLSGWQDSWGVSVEGLKRKPEQIQWNNVGPSFFKTMEIPLLLGRGVAWADTANSNKVVIVNKAFARHFLGGGNPIGRKITFRNFVANGPDFSYEIVGMAQDARYNSLRRPPQPTVYCPFSQAPYSMWQLHYEVRTPSNPLALIPSVRSAVRDVDANLPVAEFKTQAEQIAETLVQERLFARLSSFFSLLAVLLVCIGLYGLMAYSIGRRTHEIGVRMALGAQRSDVLRMLIREGMLLTGTGIALGIGGALALTRFLRSLLFEIKPTDPATFAGVAILLALVALAACYVPARRAMRVDPMVALRYE